MTAPRWDLEDYDLAASRARLWRWAPMVAAVLAVLGIVPAMFAGVAIALQTGSMVAMIATLLLGYIPAFVAFSAHSWRLRSLRNQLPGLSNPWSFTVARVLMLLGAVAWMYAAVTWLDPDSAFFFVACALAGAVIVLPVTALAAPTGPWLPPRWASPVLAALFAAPLLPIAAFTWWLEPSQGTAMVAVGVFLVAPALIATRGALNIEELSARGEHEAALTALVHWRIGRLRLTPRTGVLVQAGKLEDARAFAKQWIRRDRPHTWGALLQLAGECALWLGDLDDLRSLAQTALAVRPDEPVGYLLAVRHDLATDTVDELTHGLSERALEQSERRSGGGMTAAQRKAADEARMEIQLLHARVLAALGNTNDATRERDEALSRIDRERRAAAARLLHHVADADQALGEDPGPRRAEAGELDPNGIGGRLLALSAAAG